MPFSEFKNLAQVQRAFGITYREEDFILPLDVEPSSAFVQELEFTRANIDIYASEASRTELVVSPILREVYKAFHDRYSFWIQKPMVYNEQLNGVPDYMFATKSALGKTVFETPLLVVVEVKKNDFEQGWGQCLAELVVAQKINEDTARPVYGIVTDSELWKFGKLEGYTIGDLKELFGALHAVLQAASDRIESDGSA